MINQLTVPAHGLVALGAGPSAGTIMTIFISHIQTDPELKYLIAWENNSIPVVLHLSRLACQQTVIHQRIKIQARPSQLPRHLRFYHQLDLKKLAWIPNAQHFSEQRQFLKHSSCFIYIYVFLFGIKSMVNWPVISMENVFEFNISFSNLCKSSHVFLEICNTNINK